MHFSLHMLEKSPSSIKTDLIVGGEIAKGSGRGPSSARTTEAGGEK